LDKRSGAVKQSFSRSGGLQTAVGDFKSPFLEGGSAIHALLSSAKGAPSLAAWGNAPGISEPRKSQR
jgi:hypothetical protein